MDVVGGSRNDYTVSPDGTRVVFAARIKGRGEAWSTNFDLYVVPIDAASSPRTVRVPAA